MDDGMNKQTKYELAGHLVRILLKPDSLTKDNCWEMPRDQKNKTLFSNGFSLHFHTKGWLRPWARKCYLSSDSGHHVVEITKEQAVYLIVEAPLEFTHALHWLKMGWPKDEFKMMDMVV